VTFGLAPSTHTITITKTGGGTLWLDGIFAPGGSNLPGHLAYSSTNVRSVRSRWATARTSTFTVSNPGGTDVAITAPHTPERPVHGLEPLAVGQVIPAGGSVTETITYSPTAPSSDVGTYSITGNDGQGATAIQLSGSKGVTTTEYNDTDPAIAYGSGWSYSSGRGLGDYKDDLHYATANGSSATLTFHWSRRLVDHGEVQANSATSVGCRSTVGPGRRRSALYAASRQVQQTVFTVGGLTSGTHTIKFTKTGGTWLQPDAFTVTRVITGKAELQQHERGVRLRSRPGRRIPSTLTISNPGRALCRDHGREPAGGASSPYRTR